MTTITTTEIGILVADAIDKIRECQAAARPVHKELYAIFSMLVDTIIASDDPARTLEVAAKYVWHIYYDRRYEYRRKPSYETRVARVMAERLYLVFTGGVKYILRKRGWRVQLFDYRSGQGKVTVEKL